MKKTNKTPGTHDELRAEYDFDYRKAKPNRFAAGLKKGTRMIVLDAEIAKAFETSKQVNDLLRALLRTMPARRNGSVG